jgi:putative transposase
MRNCVYSAKYHIIFCPKYRRKVLGGQIGERLKVLLKETTLSMGGEIIELEVMPDHVHILVEVPPPVAMTSYIKKIKGVSARILRSEFPSLKSRLPCLWTNSYFCATVGGAPLEIVKQYVANQKNV